MISVIRIKYLVVRVDLSIGEPDSVSEANPLSRDSAFEYIATLPNPHHDLKTLSRELFGF
jgi:hypothetical protein